MEIEIEVSKGEDKKEEAKKWEIECLARKIEEVEYAKKKTPDIYSAAVKELKDKASVIGSIADIKAKRQALAEMDDESEDESEED